MCQENRHHKRNKTEQSVPDSIKFRPHHWGVCLGIGSVLEGKVLTSTIKTSDSWQSMPSKWHD